MVWPHIKIFGHVEDNSAGTVKGARRRGRQKKRWEDNIKEWTEMGFGDSLRAAEDREGRKGIVATSFVVPRRPPRLRDRDERCDYNITGYRYNTLVLPCGTSRLLKRRGRVLDFCAEGRWFDPQPGQKVISISSPVTFGTPT